MKGKEPKDKKDKKGPKKYKKPEFTKHGILGRLVVAISTSSGSATTA